MRVPRFEAVRVLRCELPPLPRLKSWVPELSGNIRDTQQDRVPQARIHRVWHLPPGGDRVSHAMELFAGVLSI